jgi:hypothetical protein
VVQAADGSFSYLDGSTVLVAVGRRCSPAEPAALALLDDV